jgi:hypothetical protein
MKGAALTASAVLWWTTAENHEGRDEDAMPPQSQSIISITPAQWQQIAKAWGTSEPLVGHRS